MTQLKMIAENIGYITTNQTFLGVECGTRMTLVRVPGNKIILISPIETSATMLSDIKKLGEVTAIVAPNLFHHLHIEKCRACFPNATLYIAEGLAEKRLKAGSPLSNPYIVLTEKPESLWQGSLEQLYFKNYRVMDLKGANTLNEMLFFHRESKTLILTDTALHFTHNNAKPMQLIARFFGIFGRLGNLPMDRWIITNKPQAIALVEQILSWPFQSIILAHGDIITDNAQQKLRECYAWLLDKPT